MTKRIESAYWAEVLSGQNKRLTALDRQLRKLPAPPRCKVCGAPFRGPFAPLLKLVGFRKWSLNPQLCRYCAKKMVRHRGGAEVPVSVMYADVRGSTMLAESMTAPEFTSLIEPFYNSVYRVVDSQRGVIDHLAGDGAMALWIPTFVAEHQAHACAAGELLLEEINSHFGDALNVGVGVHTGTAYVGILGHDESLDFTVLGDVPNTVARLSSAAEGGELVLSDEIVTAVGLETGELRTTELQLKGKERPVRAWVKSVPPA